MFKDFKYEAIPLSSIRLDDRNPRIVTQKKLGSEDEILRYFYEHEDLASFLKKIASEGRNTGAERPYVIKSGNTYVVVEGNTRIAAYKLLTGQLSPPDGYAGTVPQITDSQKDTLRLVDCSIAPSRDALLPIMAKAHFGLGDKSKWGYLGSRKAVYDEWKAGRAIHDLAKVFGAKKGQIRDYLIEYVLYLEALKFKWTPEEEASLTDPAVAFNPPVRFLEGAGHKEQLGIELDRINTKLSFVGPDSKNKFRHLIKKLVISPTKGLGATASYEAVFQDYKAGFGDGGDATSGGSGEAAGGSGEGAGSGPKLKTGALFNYPVNSNSLLLAQLMKEASEINSNKLPAAATSLVRSIMEAILKHIIDAQKANAANRLLSLESALDLCLGNAVKLAADDKKILKEFKKSHLDFVNLGVHATVVPTASRLMDVRGCIDQFVKRNI